MHLDPRVSLIILFISLFIVLFTPLLIFHIGFVVIFFVLYTKIQSFTRALRLCLFLVIPTIIISILNWVYVSQDVAFNSLIILRFWALTWLFNWFLSHVSPLDLAKALWSFHLPYRYAWQISLAYRFLPVFQEESKRIYNAQISRGIPLDQGLFQKLKYLPSLSIPLLVMTQDKAELFAEALFARNWNSRSPKSVLTPLKMSWWDWLILCLILVLLAIVFAI